MESQPQILSSKLIRTTFTLVVENLQHVKMAVWLKAFQQ